jgi:hypothetical protein
MVFNILPKRPRKTWMEGVKAATTTRNLEPDQWRNREEWRLFSGDGDSCYKTEEIDRPLFVLCIMSIMFSIESMECLLSNRCCANLDLLFPYLKSQNCSWNFIWKDLPVCPMYFILQSRHVNWYTPHFSNLLRRWLFCLYRMRGCW